jgi:hypothetical protein
VRGRRGGHVGVSLSPKLPTLTLPFLPPGEPEDGALTSEEPESAMQR